jgi:hypothetical protein
MGKGAGSGDDLDRPQLQWDGTQYVPSNFQSEPGGESEVQPPFSNRPQAYGVRFRTADLILNRIGRMSVMQRLRLLVGDVEWWLIAGLLIAGPALLFVAVRAGLLPLSLIKDIELVGFGLYSLGIGLWALYRAIDVGIDVVRGRVRSQLTHLPVSPSTMEQHRTFYSFRTDEGVAVRVQRQEFKGIDPDDLYRVYFAPVSKQLINLEDAGPSYGLVPRL